MTAEELLKEYEEGRRDFSWEDLRGVNLIGANLRGINLIGADLFEVNLSEADLSEANLIRANLIGADLSEADLSGADLSEAVLNRADLTNVVISNNTVGYFSVCPTKGAFRGFKKACCDGNHVIVELLIPEDARRSSATGRKCRCDKAQVINITDMNGNHVPQATSSRNESFIYRVGEMVEEPSFCEDRWAECAEGIHFFITYEEAKLYAI